MFSLDNIELEAIDIYTPSPDLFNKLSKLKIMAKKLIVMNKK